MGVKRHRFGTDVAPFHVWLVSGVVTAMPETRCQEEAFHARLWVSVLTRPRVRVTVRACVRVYVRVCACVHRTEASPALL